MKKFLSLLLAAMMIFSVLPTVALADGMKTLDMAPVGEVSTPAEEPASEAEQPEKAAVQAAGDDLAVTFKGISKKLTKMEVYAYQNGQVGAEKLLEITKNSTTVNLPAGDYWIKGYDSKNNYSGGIKMTVNPDETNTIWLHIVYQIEPQNTGWVEGEDYIVSIAVKDASEITTYSTEMGKYDSGSTITASCLVPHKGTFNATYTPTRKRSDEGYVEVSYELNPMVQQVGVSLRTAPMVTTGNLEEDMKQAVLKNYLFYANYSSVSENEKTIYYFKTPELSDNFITEINKYDKTDFKTETVKKIIGAETSQEILDNAIESKRIIAEKREAARRKEEEARRAAAQRQAQSSQIHDTSPVSDNAVVSYALQFRGNPYVYGGTSLTNGADCSGFVQSIYKHFGVSLPRTASAQASAGRYVSWGDLQPGDLVFYSGNGGQSVTHVAIYIGNSQIIHASTPSGGIKTSSVNIMTKMTARRVI